MGRICRKTRFRVLSKAGFCCRYCGRSAPDVVLEVDHVTPRALGGRDHVANLVAACFDCNRGKRDEPLAIVEAAVDLKASGLLACGDSCPRCPSELFSILPFSARRDGNGFVMAYRCPRGHQWNTWWEEKTAHMHARQHIDEHVTCWPSLAEAAR